jgi:uncharacterized OB-fold protein
MAEPKTVAERSTKPLPRPTPETQHFWDGTLAGELRLQRCEPCSNVYFPPRPFCPKCASRSVHVFTASGRGTLHSYVINQRAAPDSGFEAPYSIALVELDEGPRMMTNIVDSPQTPEALVLDMPVEVTFARISEHIALPLFRPRDPSSNSPPKDNSPTDFSPTDFSPTDKETP